jgi:hypothetical protein
MIEGTLQRYPNLQIAGETPMTSSYSLNQYKALPVRVG